MGKIVGANTEILYVLYTMYDLFMTFGRMPFGRIMV